MADTTIDYLEIAAEARRVFTEHREVFFVGYSICACGWRPPAEPCGEAATYTEHLNVRWTVEIGPLLDRVFNHGYAWGHQGVAALADPALLRESVQALRRNAECCRPEAYVEALDDVLNTVLVERRVA